MAYFLVKDEAGNPIELIIDNSFDEERIKREIRAINRHIDLVVLTLRHMMQYGPDPLGRGDDPPRVYWIRRRAKERIVSLLVQKRSKLEADLVCRS